MFRKRFLFSPLRFPTLAGIAALLLLLAPIPSSAAGQNLLLEAEDFQLRSNWALEGGSDQSGGLGLKSEGSNGDALTVIDLPVAAHYHCWVRSKDYKTQDPGKRRFKLVIDGQAFETEAGTHGENGYRWQQMGARELSAGQHVIGLRDTACFFGRCDAIFLTSEELNPNQSNLASLSKYRIEPEIAEITFPSRPFLNFESRDSKPVAEISNDHVRVTFFSGQDATGKPVITRQTESATSTGWVTVPADQQKEILFLIWSDDPGLRTSSYFPTWNGPRERALLKQSSVTMAEGKHNSEISITVGGKVYRTMSGTDPFAAGDLEPFTPRSCTQIDKQTAEVTYEGSAGTQAKVKWNTLPGRKDVAMTTTFTAGKDGAYSLGFSAFQPWTRSEVEWNLLPPVFNYQRLPDQPKVSTSSVTPHAFAMVQPVPAGENRFTFTVIADPEKLPFEWPTPTNAKYGFSLLNAQCLIQPTIFAPLLGFPDSLLKAGESKTVSWSVLANPGDWKDSLEYASNTIFEVKDYRRQYLGSLTDAAFNMIDLIKDDEHAGWSTRLKGFWNIESASTVTQSSPLMLISAAVLAQDEDFYIRRALPSIEFALSRPSSHFADRVPEGNTSYVDAKKIQLNIPSQFYGVSFWQGLHDLLGRQNPWIGEIAMTRLNAATPYAYGKVPKWSDLLAAYRLDPAPERLREVVAECDTFLKTEVYGRQTKDLGIQPFYNVSWYPYWWDLVDLYEVTGDRKYVQAAEEGAFHTLAGLWSHPRTPTGEVTVHQDKEKLGSFHVWWKEDQLYRLGYPLKESALPEKKLPAWLVSRVGLGLEQPSTYYAGGNGPMNNILMSCWAPHLLRVYQYTGRDIYQTYARNTILGRFNTYPGYYVRTYSDVPLNPRYPLEGPDITSIYYHHIPPHLAFTLDFLVSEANLRSNGQICFPWVKQQAYVWFSNRVYGHAPGKIYDNDNMRLFFDRRAVHVDSEQVNYLTARGEKRFDLVLLNETSEPLTSRITLDHAKLGVDPKASYTATINGTARKGGKNAAPTVQIPGKGVAVLSFPASRQVSPKLAPVAAAPVQQELAGDWGKLHAFRIRSPFGKDSLYVVLTGRPENGGTAKLLLENGEKEVPPATAFPYEFTVYPWPVDQELKFRIQLTDASGAITESTPVSLPGINE